MNGDDTPPWGPINDQWLMTAIARIPRDLWPTGLRLGDTVVAVVEQYEAIREAGGTPASPQGRRRGTDRVSGGVT